MPRFSERAPIYDRENRSHTEDFADLHEAGLIGATVPRRFGGLGLGYSDARDPLPLWLITKTLARADLALARNWESHVNTVETVSVIGTPEQAERFGRAAVE